MLKRRLIPLLVALVPPFVVLAVLLAQRSIPAAEASDLYRRYEHSEHVAATFLRNFPANDSVSVDVTLLKAQDSTTWANLVIELCHDGNREDFLPGEIFFKPIPKEDAAKIPNDELKNDYIIISCLSELTIGIFHLENVQQQKTIIDRYINNLITKN